jgi:signal transduction histidine kinase
MFRSLGSRLWLSYALLIGLVLCVVGAAIVLVVMRSNIPLQQAALSLQRLRLNAMPKLRAGADLSPDTLQAMLTRGADSLEARIVILTPSGEILADSMAESGIDLPDFKGGPGLTKAGDLPKSYRDNQGNGWYYIVDIISQDRWAFFAVYRPRLQLVSLFRDEFLRPFVLAGLLALFFSIILSLVMTRWVSAPLKRISREAHQVAAGEARPIPPNGPREVQQLARAFNEMTAQVQQSQQAQRDFVANVSHELKTPLTSIQGFAQAILDGTVDSPQALDNAAEVINSESNRMHRLVMDLLALARLDAGTAGLVMSPLDVNALLDAAEKKFAPIAREAGISLTVCPGEVSGRILGDPDRLMQVLSNLVDNAIKFTPAGGTISLLSRQVTDVVQIHVMDTGQGIPPEDQKRIFERFYQVDKARPGGVERGVGLGLAISQQIVRAHGGEISLTSKPGEGSHFVVKIPLQHDDFAGRT